MCAEPSCSTVTQIPDPSLLLQMLMNDFMYIFKTVHIGSNLMTNAIINRKLGCWRLAMQDRTLTLVNNLDISATSINCYVLRDKSVYDLTTKPYVTIPKGFND